MSDYDAAEYERLSKAAHDTHAAWRAANDAHVRYLEDHHEAIFAESVPVAEPLAIQRRPEGAGAALTVRFSGPEFHRIAERAEHVGLKLTDWLRVAALEAATGSPIAVTLTVSPEMANRIPGILTQTSAARTRYVVGG